MLQQLTIHNYTIIRDLSIRFEEGFNVITGETGAGKSILVGALSLVLGQRADSSVLYDRDKKSIIEACFRIQKENYADFFTENDIDYEDECLLRREITPQGKSRAFINDTPVSLNILRQLAERLVDIHSQHANLLLQDKGFQLRMIDQFAHLQPQLTAYRSCYREYVSLQAACRRLQEERKIQDTDYLNFLNDELENAKLRAGEQEELETELESLTHAEEIKQELYVACMQLSEGEENILSALRDVERHLSLAARHHNPLSETVERLRSSLIELEDLAAEICREQEGVAFDPEKTERIRERIDLLYSLQQKHHVNGEAGLLEKQEEIRLQLQHAGEAVEEVERLQAQIAAKRKQLESLAEDLHRRREAVLAEMQQALTARLQGMQMPHARTSIRLEVTECGENGKDEAVFCFSANAGVELQPIAKIASGGEMSRVMLAIKALISQKNILPTILFDEIDSGVSGEVSSKMANVMRSISTYSQVIAITHQAQIAAKADAHYCVYKETADGQTHSNIQRLNTEESQAGIARMIGDGALTETALQMAADLMKNR